MFSIPHEYVSFRNEQPDEICLNFGGISLFKLDQLKNEQLGYSTAPDGSSLCTGEEGSWNENWIVIGNEQLCGDPFFIDREQAILPVYTAAHGEGEWNPLLVANSLDVFGKIIKEFSQLAMGRSNPVEYEMKPISAAEKTQFLSKIAEYEPTADAIDFWHSLIDDDEADDEQ